jgi:hypothetical protein
MSEGNSNSLAIEKQESRALSAHDPGEMLYLAVSQGADLDKISKLMDLQERWQREQARQAFIQAESAFKAESIVVLKDKINPQYNSRYPSLGNLVATVTPFLSRHGLSVSWDIDQTSGIKVSAIMSHALGHSKSVSLTVPPDKSGSKNPLQEIKSAITYAKGCTYESVTGLASTEASASDDGNGSGKAFSELPERLEWVANASSLAELQKIYAEAYRAAKAAGDTTAMKQIVAAKDKRKAEL